MTFKRQTLEQEKIQQFLQNARIGHLGLYDGEYPYVIPLNFIWWRDSIYFHGTDSGKKSDCMHRHPQVSFTVSEEFGTLADPVPGDTDTAFMSVIVTGRVERLTDLDEATDVLQQMLNKYVPGYFESPLAKHHVKTYRSSRDLGVTVFRIQTDTITAKENPLKEGKLFYPGRTQKQDLRQS
ncbi:pyridoxamine 5'-phosphate oxidase family protein [Brevibacillus sp. B_LB10_24]|uniref:pyridoxamine 5'-phosphate oxidase family protein n=1 Tax=Brevibacillus sp. B_LB10_24 TaxID=3380645 RepID=UPI0038B9D8A2